MLNDEQMFELLISYCQRKRANWKQKGVQNSFTNEEHRGSRKVKYRESETKREGELFLITHHSKQAPNGNLLQVATSIVVPQLVSSLKMCFLCSSLSLFLLFNS